MPLKLNIGLSRKVGEANYGSRGASVNVELEVDGSLVSEPARLHERIRELFALVRHSLAEELNGAHPTAVSNGSPPAAEPSNPATGGDPRPESQTPRTGRARAATPAQVKAIYAIGRAGHLSDAEIAQRAQEQYGCSPEQLERRDASNFIDALKQEMAGGATQTSA